MRPFLYKGIIIKFATNLTFNVAPLRIASINAERGSVDTELLLVDISTLSSTGWIGGGGGGGGGGGIVGDAVLFDGCIDELSAFPKKRKTFIYDIF